MLVNVYQLYFKYQRTVGANCWAYLPIPIAEGWWYKEAPLTALRHQLHALCPTLDHLAEGEARRPAALHRAIEYSTVDECAVVVAGNGVVGRGLCARAFCYDLVLEAAGKFGYTSLRLILRQEILPFLQVLFCFVVLHFR